MTLSHTGRKKEGKGQRKKAAAIQRRGSDSSEKLYGNPFFFLSFEATVIFSIGKQPFLVSSFSQQPFWLRGANPTPNSDLAVSIKLLCHKVLTPQILRPTRFSLLALVLEVVKLAREEMHTRERQLRSKVS